MAHTRKTVSAIAILIVMAMVGPVFILASGATETARSGSGTSGTTIGISKIVAHPALDAIEQGIIDQLTSLGYDEIAYDLQNANNDISTAASIASKFKNDGVDLAVGIATPTAQALVNAIDDIPVVFAAVTDPVGAGLIASTDSGEGNVTGSSDVAPVQAQLELIASLMDVRTIGHVYASGESNAVSMANMARDVAESMGMAFVEATVVNSSEVRAATQSIADRVDALYVSLDNTVVSALSALTDVAESAGIPVVSADTTSAEDGGVLLALGFNYYKFGRATGRLVADILDGADPAAIPTLFLTDPSDLDLFLNLDVAEALGIEIPADILSQVSIVYENGAVQ